jgi:hypothetical protein
MADYQRIDILIDRVLEMTRFVSEQQAQIRALFLYLHEQPSYDPAHLGKLLEQERVRLKALREAAGGPDAVLQALFRDCEGPLQ